MNNRIRSSCSPFSPHWVYITHTIFDGKFGEKLINKRDKYTAQRYEITRDEYSVNRASRCVSRYRRNWPYDVCTRELRKLRTYPSHARPKLFWRDWLSVRNRTKSTMIYGESWEIRGKNELIDVTRRVKVFESVVKLFGGARFEK